MLPTLIPALLLATLACQPPSQDSGPVDDTGPSHPCLQAGADCTLAETATARGVHAGAAVPNGPSDERLAAMTTHFDSATAENAMKWGATCPTLGSCDYTQADAFMDFAEGARLRIRGHTLVWGQSPGHGHPGDLATLAEQADDPYTFMEQAITDHVTAMVGRYRGRVESWDVINEPLAPFGSTLDESVFYNAMGPDYLDLALRVAHQVDPNARLFVNEYVVSDYDGDKALAFVGLLDELMARGAPIHGAGIQAHLYLEVPELDALTALIATIAALGLDVELTEMDVAKLALQEQLDDGEDLFEAQAAAYGVLVQACLAEPRCTGVTTWGIDDGDSWLDSMPPYDAMAPHLPLLLDTDLQPKPAYHTVRELLASGGEA